jgi:hypothetical protein
MAATPASVRAFRTAESSSPTWRPGGSKWSNRSHKRGFIQYDVQLVMALVQELLAVQSDLNEGGDLIGAKFWPGRLARGGGIVAGLEQGWYDLQREDADMDSRHLASVWFGR